MAVTPFKSSDNFNMAGFNEKITEADNTYIAKTGGSMTGALSMGNNKITDVASPVADGDAVNKGYVDRNKVQKTFTFLTNYATTESYYCVLRDLNNFSYIRISTNNKNSARYYNGMEIKVGNVSLFSYSSYYSTAVIISLVKGDDNNFVVSGSSVSEQGGGIVSVNKKISLSDLKIYGIVITMNMSTIDTGNYSCGSIVVI